MKLNMYKEFESLILYLEDINLKLKKELKQEEFEDLKAALIKFDYFFKTLNEVVSDAKKINIDEDSFTVRRELYFMRTVIINMELNFLKTYELVNNVLESFDKGFKKVK